MVDVLLVDDHEIVRNGLKRLLRKSDKVNVVGEANDGYEAIKIVGAKPVDVVLMDINMPNLDGIEATKVITEKFPNVKVLALTMHSEKGYITQVLKAGAVGYILKNVRKPELVDAIHKVNSDGNYFCSEVTEIMMSRYMKNSTPSTSNTNMVSISDLTKREREILRLVADGYTNVKISEKLYISPRTVDTHRRNLLQKIGVNNTAGLVRFALEANLID